MEKRECTKIAFNTYEEAFTELNRILDTQHKPWSKNDKKVCRAYLCQWCDKYHLTSKITIY